MSASASFFFRAVSSKARRDRALPVATLLRKVLANARAFVRGVVDLRACNEVGPRARCFGRPHVRNAGRIVIGADFAGSSTFGALELAAGDGGELVLGDAVVINYGTTISARRGVRVGDGAHIGPYCVIADADLPLPLSLPAGSEPAPIEIGAGAWLGARVTVLPGTRIGPGAVISAGSVVVGEIPANAVASGNPARVLRVIARVPSSPPPQSGQRPRRARSPEQDDALAR